MVGSGDSAGAGSSPLARGLLPQAAGAGGGGGIIPARAGFTSRSAWAPTGCRDHPRSRGVYPWRTAPRSREAGSSPLARGLPRQAGAGGDECRIIPARAGFTVHSKGGAREVSDHPRSRGVYSPAASAEAAVRGSSPLARGLQPPPAGRLQSQGIIPARAGFTRRTPAARGPPRDHPRSRGVYYVWGGVWAGVAGSSPLARGLLGYLSGAKSDAGIIPARAGFTPRLKSPPVCRRGSSPLARGLRFESRSDTEHRWIIPARAGFTRLLLSARPRPRDHPRSRGVYATANLADTERAGSSPLARGLPSSRSSAAACSPDHPRSRGVYQGVRFLRRSCSGSSPLARGLRAPTDRLVEDVRIIPARAGFTAGR